MTNDTATRTFTPGPWKRQYPNRVVARKADTYWHVVADCSDDADARLIAKAPEMYEMLRAVEPLFVPNYDMGEALRGRLGASPSHLSEWVAAARALLKEIDG